MQNRRYAAALLLPLALAACSSGTRPSTAAESASKAAPLASPSPSASPVAAVTVDDAARTACQLLIHTKADTGDASPNDPTLQQVADLLATSQHFSLRFDGKALGDKLAAYRAAKGSSNETAASAAVTQAAKALDASCTANGAYKTQG